MSDRNTDPANCPRRVSKGMALALAGVLALAGCEEGANLSFLQPKDKGAQGAPSNSTKLVERDVEAPDVFQVTEAGLWDGRPSIGGVWVAHPDVKDPERVIIRNNANGKFVIGALFRRERAIPGPRLQVSSDAAAALSMLAGAPVELNVTALRREAVEETPATSDIPEIEGLDESPQVAASAAVETETLDPIAGGAAAAIEATAPAATPAPASPKPAAPAPARSALTKPYIQIGIFSVEANAKRTADQMRNAGIIPTIYEQSSNGKAFWRVVVGPAQSKGERTQLLKAVKSAGFADAYAVTN
ncbi:SPOR domain-containing protein [Tritonibacter mobilis]|uniref:SPOR domain-containing protein n=1 Tax=Tritonibacter mobilis TaxID=379347 RepID=UPI0009C09A9E|nr:SPOR domain-containing protein [Tritonibacter mobilis]